MDHEFKPYADMPDLCVAELDGGDTCNLSREQHIDGVTEISGTITTADGERREFSITAGLGWQQWGNTTDKLGDTVDVLESLTAAAAEFMAEGDTYE